MNPLTIIVPYYNSEDYITACVNSLKSQRNQAFDIIFVNDGSTDESPQLLQEALKDYDKSVKHIQLEKNYGHAHARNVAIDAVKTDYFLFLDSDDTLASYAITYYMKHLNGLDGLVAPINKFSLREPQFVNEGKVSIDYYNAPSQLSHFLRKSTACNIIFKTAIVHAHHIRFNENIRIHSDWSFTLEYIKHVDRFVRISGFPFYFRGEIYDPFETGTLTEQDFDIVFQDYVDSFYDALTRIEDANIESYVKHMMFNRLKRSFDPHVDEISQRYRNNATYLTKLARTLKGDLVLHGKPIFKLEMFLLTLHTPKWAYAVNRFRYRSRHIKKLLLRQKGKERSAYLLTDKPENVNPQTVVFESFGGKNYSDSPKYIYEYMQKHYPTLNYKWVFNKPDEQNVPGSAELIKKGSEAYYRAYSEAAHWVTNARLPLYLNKKENQTYIQTWHGTPLKRLANDMKTVRMPGTTTAKYKINFNKETSRWDYLISPNRYSTDIFRTAFWMDEPRMLEIGYPRNDVLVNEANNTALMDKIREKINVPTNKKIIMYAPTWRDDEFIKKGHYLFDLKIDLNNLKEKLGDEYVVLLRMHYLISNALDLSGFEDFAIDVSNYDDISELYLISDALITDYSSVMFDYGILKRPQFFFAYDIEKYDKGLRGFYLDYMKDLPGPIFTDADALADSLQDIPKVKKTYKKQIDAFYDRFCSIENGQASKYIGDLIYNNTTK